MRENIIFGGMAIVMIVWLVVMFWTSLDQGQKNECLVWKDQATHYLGYYITPWQKMQCDHYGVVILAPVK